MVTPRQAPTNAAAIGTDRDQIESLCQRLDQAHHDKDAAAIVGCYAPDAVIH